MKYHVQKSLLQGNITVTTSKSHTMRAILFATLAEGESTIFSPLPSPDTQAMILACRALGAKIEEKENSLVIQGTGGVLTMPSQVLDVGNSGQVLRFGAAIASLLPGYTVITGDASICSIRPMDPLLEGLTQLGAFAVSTKGDGHAPIIIKGPAKAGHATLDGQDSQPVSALLMLAAFLKGTTTLLVKNPGELPWIDLTLHWLDRFHIPYEHTNYAEYTVHGPVWLQGFEYTVPGDWSSAAFPIAAALVCNSKITLGNMDIHDPQGDKAIVDIFTRMGANITIDEEKKELTVHSHNGLQGIEVDVNAAIDAVPILAAVACFAKSPTTITGAGIARHKECDRIAAITLELTKMGARIEEHVDGMRIYPSVLHGAEVASHHDHRIAMALAVAALSCNDTTIFPVDCVAKSFPGFATAMGKIGARIQEIEE